MPVIRLRTTSTHRPMFLTVGKDEYEVDGIDATGEGDFTIEERWIIQKSLEPFPLKINTYQGGHGEFYVSDYTVPENFNIFEAIKGANK